VDGRGWEHCDECGFNGGAWTDDGALAILAELPKRWADAIARLDDRDLVRRPIAAMWSIAEYTDHVREVIFGMRFVLDVALTAPGTNLGLSPEPHFDPDPQPIDAHRALTLFEDEVRQLCTRLDATARDRWDAHVRLDGDLVDVSWIVRHAVHDVSHHLGDIARLRTSLSLKPPEPPIP
jgi:uncharacterized damage-inducible protein DinB